MSIYCLNSATKGGKAQQSSRNRVTAPFGNTFSSAISQIEDQSDEPLRKKRFFGSAFSRYSILSFVQ
jgi:hypothetical protein